MFKSLKNFVIKLQNADEGIKKIWLVILTAVIMIFVVGVWIFSLNRTIPALTAQKSTPEIAALRNNSEGNGNFKASLWQIFLSGFKTIIIWFKTAIFGSREVIIEPPRTQ